MNNDKLSLHNPDNVKNKIVRNRTQSIDIPQWNKFADTNNEIPTMDYSPIYDNRTHVVRKKSPNKTQQIQTQEPIRIGYHNKLHESKGLLAQIYDWCVGNNTE